MQRRDGAEGLPAWAAQASCLPLAFAQVREDAAIELRLAAGLRDGAKIALVASGGCTAAALAAVDRGFELHAFDIRPAQLALARLKFRLLRCSVDERLALLGHAPMRTVRRRARLAEELALLGYRAAVLGPPALVARWGPDHAGRYERLFAALRAELTGGSSLGDAFSRIAAPEILLRVFGPAACREPRRPFAAHFAHALGRASARKGAADNPYLAQILRGRFSADLLPWLEAPPLLRSPAVRWQLGDMETALGGMTSAYDLIQVSNILDWMSEDKAARLLRRAWTALRPGGRVLVRQLNSSHDIRRLEPWFEWEEPESRRLSIRERSGLYRAVHLGTKR